MTRAEVRSARALDRSSLFEHSERLFDDVDHADLRARPSRPYRFDAPRCRQASPSSAAVEASPSTEHRPPSTGHRAPRRARLALGIPSPAAVAARRSVPAGAEEEFHDQIVTVTAKIGTISFHCFGSSAIALVRCRSPATGCCDGAPTAPATPAVPSRNAKKPVPRPSQRRPRLEDVTSSHRPRGATHQPRTTMRFPRAPRGIWAPGLHRSRRSEPTAAGPRCAPSACRGFAPAPRTPGAGSGPSTSSMPR
jgi:hypothetical protein